MKDYIIVGGGLAGLSFAETCLQYSRTFALISDESCSASLVAGGVYNPVILKRLNMPMDAGAHMDYIKLFFRQVENRLGVTFMHDEVPVLRRFASAEEQNNWFRAADKPGLGRFLNTEIKHEKITGLPAPFGFGKVNETGYMDTGLFVSAFLKYLSENGYLVKQTFNHDKLEITADGVSYDGITARNIVFAEGFGLKNNPFFNYLPLNGTKGEMIIIKAPSLALDFIAKGNVFIMPLGDSLFRVGATYEWEDKTTQPTERGCEELIGKLEEMLTCEYEVVSQQAGIRPTVTDRKCLVGTHNDYDNVHVLNGLGTRGVMLGPPMAKHLFDYIEYGTPVPADVNINRFKA